MKTVESIAVYNPTDALERAVQESFHSSDRGWLSSYECQTIARSISSLKCSDDWINNSELLEHRIAYFFAPFMCKDKSVMVFPTHPLFVRDILENCVINAYLHDPITFVTPPLAHYIFRDYPIHIYVEVSSLKGYNEVPWVDRGGLLVTDEDLKIKPSAIVRVQTKEPQYTSLIEGILSDIEKTRGVPLSKMAISQLAPGVFTPDRDERNIEPDNPVWDKKSRTKGFVTEVEAGETGLISVLCDDGQTVTIPKVDFDQRFIVG